MAEVSTALEVLTIGVGATAVMDLIAALRARLTGRHGLDYALFGRWVLLMRAGQWRHESIAAAPAQRGERAFGWLLHYVIGAIWALPMLWLVQAGWGLAAAALLMGLGSVLAPWLLMQPAFGMGIAARRLPNPGAARLGSLLSHLAFALGLWISACVVLGG